MGIARGPHLIKDNLVFGYDTGYGVADSNTSTRFYPGEPTTNLKSSNQTSGQIAGMSGVSLTYVGEENGYSKYSMSGTFSGGTYPYCMYLPGVSFTGGTAYSTQVKLKTTASHKFNYFGGGINYVNQPQNSAGTNSSVLQSDGFNYIKREGFNYVSTTGQSGYIHSNPINNTTFNSSTDFIYIKDFQIEQNSHSTVHTPTSRSSTQSLIDLKRTTDINVSNVSFDSTGQPDFDGTDDYISKTRNQYGISDSWSVELVFEPTDDSDTSWNGLFGGSLTQGGYWFFHSAGNLAYYEGYSGAIGSKITYRDWKKSNTFTQDNHHHLVITYTPSSTTAGTFNLYYNGGEKTDSFSWTFGWNHSLDSRFIGSGDGRFGTNNVRIYKEYSKAITAEEVKQNFNAYKNRFNI